MISQPTTSERIFGELKSQLIRGNCFFLIPTSDLESSFFLGISYIRSILYTNHSNFLQHFLLANFFSSPRKVGPHAQQHPVQCFPSQQQLIDLNNQQKFQFTPNKIYIFKSPSNDQATF